MANNTYIGPPIRPSVDVGDKVSIIFDGEVTEIDPGTGVVTVEGVPRGTADVPWSVEFSETTEFYLDDGTREPPER